MFYYFGETDKIGQINRGEVLPETADQKKVAAHYDISVFDLARKVAIQINLGEITWEAFDGLHPGPTGHKLPDAEHELVLRTTARKDAKSNGRAARIVAFMAN